MGGMAAQIPIKGDNEANEAAMAKVRADKEREATQGFDGTWDAHPGLVPLAKEIFDRLMPGPNQLEKKREDVCVKAKDLLAFEPSGPITEAGLRTNVNVSLQYIGSWLAGNGCVPINNLMEDAATAEISRSQIWQWLHPGRVTAADVRRVTEVEMATLGPGYDEARAVFERIATQPEYVEFLTLPAYDRLLADGA